LQLLRRDVGFQGACISDDLEMKAIADTYGVVDGAELAVSAGCDGVLVCHTLALQHQAIDGIARGARAGPLPRERLAEAAARMEKLQRFARPASSIDPEAASTACATREHGAFLETVAMAKISTERPRDPTEWRTTSA
jgi:beta-N-acetylhexosaminidase